MVDPRSLDALDPPRWGSAPPDATFLVRRCYELRANPIDDFSVEDLRLVIGQQIALPLLIPLALELLEADPLAEGDFFPGALLTVVLRVDASFWQAKPLLARQLEPVVAPVPADAELTQAVDHQLAADVASFRVASRP